MANKRDLFEKLVYEVNAVLKQSDLYQEYVEDIQRGENDYKISQVYTKKNYDDSWIDVLDDSVVALDNIVRNPRKFIVIEEDIVDISLARSISVESVKHLAQHTNFISSVTKEGMVIPSKILNTSKEESFEIYENRFIYTLLLKVRDFIDRRFGAIKNALMTSGDLGIEVNSKFEIEGHKVDCKMETTASFPFDETVRNKNNQMSNVERLSRISSIINDFLASPFAKTMRTCALVRPPITRTNVILKNPNFKKALVLWQYIESTDNFDYKVESAKETTELNEVMTEKYRNMVFFNTVLLQSIASTRESGESIENAMQKQQQIADEYLSKNIDDFIPDDFPQLKLDLKEVQHIFQNLPHANILTPVEIMKVNAAIDRIFLQHQINKIKQDNIIKQQLLEQKRMAEIIAKRLAQKEAREQERKKKQAAIRKELELKRLEDQRKKAEIEKLKAEKLAEIERKKQEKENARQQRIREREQAAREAEERKNAKHQRIVEAKKLAILRAENEAAAIRVQAEEDRIRREYEAKIQQEESERQHQENLAAIAAEHERMYTRLIAEIDSETAKKIENEEKLNSNNSELRRQEEEKLANAIAAKVNAREDAVHQAAMAQRQEQMLAELRQEQQAAIQALIDIREEYWKKEREQLVTMQIERNRDKILQEHTKALNALMMRDIEKRNQLQMMNEYFTKVLEAEHVNAEWLMKLLAHDFLSPEQMDAIFNRPDPNTPPAPPAKPRLFGRRKK